MRNVCKVVVVLGLFLACFGLGAFAQSEAASHASDDKWTPYRNARWSFCAAFPSNWKAQEMFDGEMLRATATGSADEAQVTLGGFLNRTQEGNRRKPLPDVAEDAEDDLRDTMVKQLKTRNERATVAGLPALITYQGYSRADGPWLAKEVRIQREDDSVVELILRAPEEDFVQLEEPFDAMVSQQFQPKCAAQGR